MIQKITISLPPELAIEMKDYAKSREQSFSGLVRMALKQLVENEN